MAEKSLRGECFSRLKLPLEAEPRFFFAGAAVGRQLGTTSAGGGRRRTVFGATPWRAHGAAPAPAAIAVAGQSADCC